MKLRKDNLLLACDAAFLAAGGACGALYAVYGGLPLKGAAGGVLLLCALFHLLCAVVRGKGRSPYPYLLSGGLACAFAGDMALGASRAAGVILSAAGYLLLFAALGALKPLGWRDILPSLVLAAGTVCLTFLLPNFSFGKMTAGAAVYAVVLSAAAGKAAGVSLDPSCGLCARLLLLPCVFLAFGDLLALFALYTEVPAWLLSCGIAARCISLYMLALFVYFADMGSEKPCMNVLERLFCRAFQGGARIAIPFLPYRKPKLLKNCEEAAALAKEKGKTRALVVTDKGVREHGLLAPVTEALGRAGITYEIFDETPANPTVEAVERAYSRYCEGKCDLLFAVGGGSPMDCAKGVCAKAIRPGKPLVKMKGLLKVVGKAPLFFAVPTTAGTGSEATIAAVLTDGKTHHKFTILSFCLMPKYAILDPMFTKPLPPAPTAETGLDALTHAVEAYIGRATTRSTRRLSVSAVRRINGSLLAACKNGDDLAARKEMQLAAYEAGLAFTVSYVGYVHAVAHSLGGAYNYPHGRTNATLLPIVLRAYGKKAEGRLAKLAKRSGVCAPSLPRAEAAAAFIAWIETLNRETGIPATLEVEEKDIPALAKNAAKEANPLYPVPRLMNAAALEELYRAARTRRSYTPQEALALQKSYFATGATLGVKSRKYNLEKLCRAVVSHEEELNEAMKSDLGKTPFEGYMCETGMVRAEISYLKRRVRRYARGKRVLTPLSQYAAKSYLKPSPYGCVLVMSPWNYPVLLALEPLADAIAAGNCAIVKPSAYSPATSAALARLIGEVFPPERVYVVLGGRAENDVLLDMPFDKIFFTGSVNVGKEVMRRAAEKLVPVTLELGGKSPCVVDETANIPLAARRIVFGKFLNCGQTCVAPDHVLVHRSVEEKLLNALKEEIVRQYGKDPLRDPDYGKIVNLKHFERVSALIDPEKVFCGGETDRETLRIAPTVLRNAAREDAAMREEIFGPVLPVLVYDDEDELLAELQALPSPLAFYLFTGKKKTAKKFFGRLPFGGGCVNDVVIHLASPALPFGGVGNSGMGVYHGKAGFDCFSHTKSIVDKKTWIDIPVRYRPYRKLAEKLMRLFMK